MLVIASCAPINLSATQPSQTIQQTASTSEITSPKTTLNVWDEEVVTTQQLVEAAQIASEQVDMPVRLQGRDPGSDALEMLTCDVPAISMSVAWSIENLPIIIERQMTQTISTDWGFIRQYR